MATRTPKKRSRLVWTALPLIATREFRNEDGSVGAHMFRAQLADDGGFRDRFPAGAFRFIASHRESRLIAGTEFQLSQDTSGLCLVLAASWEAPESEEEFTEACGMNLNAELDLPQFGCRLPSEQDFKCGIAGMVIDKAGNPVGSISILASAQTSSDCETEFYEQWGRLPPEMQASQWTTTDPGGRFSFDSLLCTGFNIIAHGMIGRFACGVAQVALDPGTTTTDVVVTVRQAGNQENKPR